MSKPYDRITDDYMLNYWLEERSDEYVRYMHAWSQDVKEEDHSDLESRRKRTVAYFDMPPDIIGGVAFYLVMHYEVEFIEFATALYWNTAKEAGYAA